VSSEQYADEVPDNERVGKYGVVKWTTYVWYEYF
jgi:hypothetical protein